MSKNPLLCKSDLFLSSLRKDEKNQCGAHSEVSVKTSGCADSSQGISPQSHAVRVHHFSFPGRQEGRKADCSDAFLLAWCGS